MQIRSLAPSEAARLKAAGAQVVDVRSADEFAADHWNDSINLGTHGDLTGWAQRLLERGHPLVLVAAAGQEQAAAGRLSGFAVAGWVEGGVEALPADQRQASHRIQPRQLAEWLSQSDPPTVLDVRSRQEFAGGHLAGALNLPLDELPARVQELPGGPLVIHCASGYRSSAAVSWLANHQLALATDLAGGFAAWAAAGLPVEK
ncbi:MAG: rhodanese-like domain-containing protein [Vulcanimicrobiota bacterium]